MAELADAQDLGSCGQPCGFDPHYPHQGLRPRHAANSAFVGFAFFCARANVERCFAPRLQGCAPGMPRTPLLWGSRFFVPAPMWSAVLFRDSKAAPRACRGLHLWGGAVFPFHTAAKKGLLWRHSNPFLSKEYFGVLFGKHCPFRPAPLPLSQALCPSRQCCVRRAERSPRTGRNACPAPDAHRPRPRW